MWEAPGRLQYLEIFEPLVLVDRGGEATLCYFSQSSWVYIRRTAP